MTIIKNIQKDKTMDYSICKNTPPRETVKKNKKYIRSYKNNIQNQNNLKNII